MLRQLIKFSIFCFAVLSLLACSKREVPCVPEANAGVKAGAAANAEAPTENADEPKKPERIVRVAVWANYISDRLQTAFLKKTGIRIGLSTFSSNEELLAKTQASGAVYDVAFPSDYMVAVMNKLGLLQPIDKTKVPNYANVDPNYLNQSFDPKNVFSLPYAWSTAGIAVNRKFVKGRINGWKDVFNTPELAGRISLLDDMREVFAIALKANGFRVNSTNEKELKIAKDWLQNNKSKVKMFKSDMIDAMAKKEVLVGHVFSSDGLQAGRRSKGEIDYIIPEEGGTRAIDNMVLLKNARNYEDSHILINFLLSAEANVDFVNKVMGGPVLKQTRRSLSQELRENSALFPNAKVMSRLEAIEDVGDKTKVYDRLWTELKAQ